MAGVFLLIILGIFLFLVEFLLVPGVTIAGIGGVILIGWGIYIAFSDYGVNMGLITVGITLLLSVVVLAITLRSRTWKKIMLDTKIDGTSHEAPAEGSIKAGDKGEAMTRLAPIGKVRVNNIVMEAKSIAGYIDPHTEIEVVKLSVSQLIVKPIK